MIRISDLDVTVFSLTQGLNVGWLLAMEILHQAAIQYVFSQQRTIKNWQAARFQYQGTALV